MTERVAVAGLSVEKTLYNVFAGEILPATGIAAEAFFAALAGLAAELGPKNRSLLAKRDAMQAAIEGYGFRKCGNIYASSGTLRTAYDYVREG